MGIGTIHAKRKRGDRNLVQIAYVSLAVEGLTPADIEAIAERADARSAAAGVTGLLLHHGTYFYAILEGPRAKVIDRIEEIIVERNQRDLRILREEAVSQRRFENWTFGALPAGLPLLSGPSEFLRNFCALLE